MYFKKPLFKDFFITSVIVAVLHYISLKYYLYWTLPWFDILMHTLGGFLVALFIIFILNSYGRIEELKKHKVFLLLLIYGLTLVVGLTWELWEVFVGFTDTFNDLGDTILDIVMDIIGAAIAIVYTKKYICEKE